MRPRELGHRAPGQGAFVLAPARHFSTSPRGHAEKPGTRCTPRHCRRPEAAPSPAQSERDCSHLLSGQKPRGCVIPRTWFARPEDSGVRAGRKAPRRHSDQRSSARSAFRRAFSLQEKHGLRKSTQTLGTPKNILP